MKLIQMPQFLFSSRDYTDPFFFNIRILIVFRVG